MLWHVLVPLDGSPLAEKALDMARRVLKPDGKITLLTSVQNPQPPLYAYPGADALEEIAQDHEAAKTAPERARAYLEHLAVNLKLNGIQTDIEVGGGDPAVLIVQRAQVLGVEAIVMSTHGRSGLSRLLFGSVTLKVLAETPCPVIVVPNREQEHAPEEQPEEGLGLDLAAE